MGEILLPACQFPRLSDGATCRDIQPQALCQACTAHVQVAELRTRLESVEAESRQAFEDHQEVCAVVINLRARLESAVAAMKEAQESRFDLILQNEELSADLVALRARLESAERERDVARGTLREVVPVMQACRDYLWVADLSDGQPRKAWRNILSKLDIDRLDPWLEEARAALGAAGERSEGESNDRS